MIRVGLIGYGYWGPNLLRNFFEARNCRVVLVSDPLPERTASLKRSHSSLRTTTESEEILVDPEIDAVVVATPVASHYELALAALQAGKHVLVEKPLAASVREAEHLVREAEDRQRVLMVDHTFVYTGAVRRIHELVRSDELGELYYYDSVRINLGLFRHDVNVVWDLAAHDFSILDHVVPQLPCSVSATGVSHVSETPEDIAYITVRFGDSLIGHLHVNWLAPVKVRRTLIGGSRRMIVYDELEPSEKVKVYDRGITVDGSLESTYQMQIGYRAGDMWAPRVDLTEALRSVTSHFLSCIEQGARPLTDGRSGLQVVRLLEATSRSMADGGRVVDLDELGGDGMSRVAP